MYRLKIKELRKERGLTQTEFAEIMNLNPVTVNRYENNKRFPDISTLISIADYFDVPLDFLVGRSWPASDRAANVSESVSSYDAAPVKSDPDFNRLLTTYKTLHDKYGMALPLDELSDEGRKKVIDYFNLIRNSEKLSI